jgi:putative ABC transport system permease protein
MTLSNIAIFLYRRALRAFPPAHREQYGQETIETFTQELTVQQRERGGISALRFTLAACLDAVTAGLAERRRRRAGRSLDGLMSQYRISWPDLKLSARLLVKYPGLTLVASLGITVAVTICAAFFSFVSASFYPTLPLDEGDRLVGLENWDVAGNNENRRSLHDFVTWRQDMKSVVDISAFEDIQAGLVIGSESPAVVKVAAMTARGFQAARVPPLLGRYLVEDDEREGAAPVLVIGYDAWVKRFAQARSVIGQNVRLGDTIHTIVGVMPERFGFPVNHQFWTPFRANPLTVARGAGPELFVFGRLAPGATMEMAQAELATIGRNTAAAFPKTHAQLQPRVYPYTRPLLDIQEEVGGQIFTMQLVISLLVVVVALNIAMLVYARSALRRGEIAVRTALGASRRRIVTQFFAEALVLAIGPALMGLGLSQVVWRFGNAIMEMDLEIEAPFWADYGLRPGTMLYTAGLAVLAAVIFGVLPALQATRRSKQSDVRQLGGGTGIRLGRMWATLVVAQVAIAVAILPSAVKGGLSQMSPVLTRPAFDPDTFVWARLVADKGEFGERLTDVMRRLRAEPDVAGVTFVAGVRGRTGRLPLEVEGMNAAELRGDHGTVSVGVDRAYFDIYGLRLVAGRGFEAQDTDAASRAIIVNRSFVRKVLAGANALGRRVRFATATGPQYGPWHEIVGVVDNLQTNPIDPDPIPANVYFALAPQHLRAVSIAVQMRAHDSPTVGAKLREITAEVDPALQLDNVNSGIPEKRDELLAVRLGGVVLSVILLTVFVFSAAGVYALMSFTVAQRRREIGIRAALGASPRRLLIGIFTRVARQIGFGIVAGVVVAIAIDRVTANTASGGLAAIALPAIALTMAVVGGLAAVGAARQGLNTQPSAALRAE